MTIEAFAGDTALESFLAGIRSSPPPAAAIEEIRCHPIPPETTAGFFIVPGRETSDLRVSIPPDLATCADCLSEIFDRGNRRYRYAFTNCTNCGPRFTITREVPYDRPGTTMAAFEMCGPCRAEYDDPGNRRFHAQPNACPACGPALSALSASGEPVFWADPVQNAARALRADLVLAVKGLGGFHLACDATSSYAVERLRRRKRRDEKPFAVMVRGIAEAEAIAVLSDAEREMLLSSERPIVLARRRAQSGLASEISPDGNPLVGLMLPYTPLHHLLLADAGRALVMTSGNLAEEPIVCGNAEAVKRLGGIADGFLIHDREIESRCDDSVVRIIRGGPVLLRRSRGWVPRAIPVARRFAEPVLACGGHLKNTFCIGLDSSAYLGPHIGDLENLETLAAFEEAVARMEGFLRVEPEIIAHDMHPQYVSTVYARQSRRGLKIAVQHHHAHVASAMAEHGLEGPVLGVAYDGTGYGTDGTAWGGELLLCRHDDFERVATFRAIPLAGGDTAIREPWRIALALLQDAYSGGDLPDSLPLLRGLEERALRTVRRMLEGTFPLPLARGAGRYFDGFGSLFLNRPFSRYEGQIAFQWNMAADPAERRPYPYAIDASGSPPEIDLRPTLRAAVADSLSGTAVGAISGRFHNTLAEATSELVRRAIQKTGDLPVVLTGGCFQNALLAERTAGRLEGLRVFLHRRVPPGDGGLALGQAVVAAAAPHRGGA